MKSSGWENRFGSIMGLLGGDSNETMSGWENRSNFGSMGGAESRGGAIGEVMGAEGN